VTQDYGYCLAAVLNRLFKNRPSCAFSTFASIMVFVLCILLLRAESRDDRFFFILILVFILALTASYAIREIRRRSVKDIHEIGASANETGKDLEVRRDPLQTNGSETFMGSHPPDWTLMPSAPSQQSSHSLSLTAPGDSVPSLSAREFLQMLVVCAGFLLVGYGLAHLLCADGLIAYLARSPDPAVTEGMIEWASEVIKNAAVQLFCAVPCAALFAPFLTFLLVLFRKVRAMGIKERRLILVAVSTVLGFASYFPTQLYILIAAAI